MQVDIATKTDMAGSKANGVIKVSTEAEVSAREAEIDRANLYRTLGALLSAPASDEQLAALRQLPEIQNPETSLEVAWTVLRAVAQQHDLASIDDEFHTLFVGLGRGIVVPYGSWHITGFLMEKPLSLLREDLRRLGFERSEGVSESEDHIACLCQVMAEIILAEEIDFATEIGFFNDHIAPWAEAFFAQVQDPPAAGFYRAVAQLGQSFIEVEKKYLAMAV
jgi:TorA maturation chaperone TorD